MTGRNKLLRMLIAAGTALALSGCVTTSRPVYTLADEAQASIPGIPQARFWADDSKTLVANVRQVGAASRIRFLALSGGGAAGAYGAGFLACWSKTGQRPQFSVVSGASVGALIAPFAFLGPAYDPMLTQMFTSGETEGLLQFAGLSGLFGTGLFRDEPLARLVNKYVTPQLLAAVAAEHAKGRVLTVVTTNLDSQRTAVWDMGAIAASGNPRALALFRSVLLASASIPGVFPPELIEVQANGRTFSEMHVDGGVTANILVVPEAVLTSRVSVNAAGSEVYAIVNGKLGPEFSMVDPQVLPIFQRAFETTVKSNTRNSLIASTEYLRRLGGNLRVTAIPETAEAVDATDFNTVKMTRLYNFGCSTAQSEDRWSVGE
jgi:predicted acylesterase/phospholipase RssA